jgi:hypothetical protein
MLLAKARDDARRGELPPREGFAFPPTRFAGDIEWRPEAASLYSRLYELQDLWERSSASR